MEVVAIQKILAPNLLIYIYLHCVRSLLWCATTLVTLAYSPQPRIDFSYYRYVPRHICFLICDQKLMSKKFQIVDHKDLRGTYVRRMTAATAAITLAFLFVEMLCYVLGRLHSSCVLSTKIVLHRWELINKTLVDNDFSNFFLHFLFIYGKSHKFWKF